MKQPEFRVVSIKASSKVEIDHESGLNKHDAPYRFQLSLPFDDQAVLTQIVIVPMDHIHGVKFCKLILDLKPLKVVDLRHLIRFDLPGTSRSEIFRHLSISHTRYVKASLPWHELRPRHFMLDGVYLSQELNTEIMEREDSPVLLLASKKDDARNLTAYLHRVLSSCAKRPWKIDQVV